ncbi:MAG: glycoside hydrolase family 57 protein [Candidatus Woesearchaeota archaeon]|jgi:alpha-amylase
MGNYWKQNRGLNLGKRRDKGKNMTASVCLYFQVHQPFRMRPYRIFDVGSKHNYFDDEKNHAIMHKIAKNCYYPTNNLILDLISETDGKLKVAYSLSGTFIEQAEKHDPKILESFKALADTGCVEFLNETYYHSLAFLRSKKEFIEQIKMHKKKINELFNQNTKVFRNTELIFNNEIAHDVNELGYEGLLAEGADKVLGWQSPNYLFSFSKNKESSVESKKSSTDKGIKVLLKNYRLSDDIAFRFSNKNWNEYPLTSQKYASWLKRSEGDTTNIFLDYETFGEHHSKETGIFDFLEHMPKNIIKEGLEFKTPSETIDSYKSIGQLDVKDYVSWADIERDISAWIGNPIQNAAFDEIYKIEEEIKLKGDPVLLDEWRKLTTSDHFYYMCTKWNADGDVHKYFSPYESPYDAYMNFMNILKDVALRLKIHVKDESKTELKKNEKLEQQKIAIKV